MPKPVLLDLFCSAGGAAMGYARAGFEVIGVDLRPQPNYPFTFREGDALEYAAMYGDQFDAIHASPPCQGYCALRNAHRAKGWLKDHPDLLPYTRTLLKRIGLPYVIENVQGAPMEKTLLLCGGMFGLGTQRHRKFESNVPLVAPGRCQHSLDHVGIYGSRPDGRRVSAKRKDGTFGRVARGMEEATRAMGIDWMTWPELTQAIPPAYTQWIGQQLITHVARRAA